MAPIYVVCPNPACNRPLNYDSRYAGTTQICPNCHQQLLLPGASAPLATVLSYLPQLTVSDLRELAAPGIVPQNLRKYLQAEAQRRLRAGAIHKDSSASKER